MRFPVCKCSEKPSKKESSSQVPPAPCDINPAVSCQSFRQLSRAAPAFPSASLGPCHFSRSLAYLRDGLKVHSRPQDGLRLNRRPPHQG